MIQTFKLKELVSCDLSPCILCPLMLRVILHFHCYWTRIQLFFKESYIIIYLSMILFYITYLFLFSWEGMPLGMMWIHSRLSIKFNSTEFTFKLSEFQSSISFAFTGWLIYLISWRIHLMVWNNGMHNIVYFTYKSQTAIWKE